MKLCTDPHGPLASAMLVGFDLIAVACETKFGGEPGFEALSADTPVQSGVEPPNPAGIPGRPPGRCPQVPDPACEHSVCCDDGATEPCGMCPPCHARRVALADEREWAREYAKVSELEEREEG